MEQEPPSTPTKSNQDNHSSSEKLPAKEKLAVGAGGLTQLIGDTSLGMVATTLYQMMLGMNPALLGALIGLPRIWDAFTDPLMGYISDNFHSKWGRRRPFIFIGAILMGMSFGLIWMVPQDWSEGAMAIWFLVTTIIYYTCFTIFIVPHQALTYEMTPNYDERTSVMGYLTFWMKIGELFKDWIVPVALWTVTAGIVSSQTVGIRMTCWIVGLVFMAGVGLLPALFTKERYYKVRQAEAAKPKFLKGIAETLQNKAFLILLALTMMQIIAGMFGSSLDYYLMVYYMFDGDIAQGATWKATLSSCYAVWGFIQIPIVVAWSKKTSKRTVLTLVYVAMIVNSVFRWFIYQPGNQWFILLDPVLGSVFWIGIGTVKKSMMADICDQDELEHGFRREGTFGAVFGWISKCAVAIAFAGGLSVLSLVGFDESLGGAQSPETFLGMRLFMVFSAIIPCILCIILLQFFPLTREKAAEIRKELEARRGTVD